MLKGSCLKRLLWSVRFRWTAIFRLFRPPRDSLQLFPLFRPPTLAICWPLLEPHELFSRRGVGHPFCVGRTKLQGTKESRNRLMAYIVVAYIGYRLYFQTASLPCGNSKNLDRVVRRMREHGVVSRPLAMRSKVLIPGPWIPRSRSLINVRLRPVLFSNSACEMRSSSSRIVRMTWPNALSTPARG